jgi:hypothetical protein
MAPDARCVYVSEDPLVVCHLRALADPGMPVCAVQAGPCDPPAGVLAEASCIDPQAPVCVVAGLALDRMPAGQARAACAAWARVMVPGSFLAVSSFRCADEAVWERLRPVCPGEPRNHTPADVASFFTGLELVPPGVVPARGWQGGWTDTVAPDSPVHILAGVGVKP